VSIPDQPPAIFAAGREHPVPLIIGNTRNEMSLFLLGSKMPADEADYLKQLQANFPDLAAALSAAYPVHDASQIRPAVIAMMTDLSFARDTRAVVRAHSAAGHPAFRYQFSRGSHRPILELLGAHHGCELLYLFQRPLGGQGDDLRMSRLMGRYWVNFAATGNPNGTGLPDWPVCDLRTETMIDFAKEVEVLHGYRNGQLDLMEKVAGHASN
jgi:para-nitrobenzyl esterase